jgi:hypothetical protein
MNSFRALKAATTKTVSLLQCTNHELCRAPLNGLKAATTKTLGLFELLVAEFKKDPERARLAREDSSKHIVNQADSQGRTPLHVAVGIGPVLFPL